MPLSIRKQGALYQAVLDGKSVFASMTRANVVDYITSWNDSADNEGNITMNKQAQDSYSNPLPSEKLHAKLEANKAKQGKIVNRMAKGK